MQYRLIYSLYGLFFFAALTPYSNADTPALTKKTMVSDTLQANWYDGDRLRTFWVSPSELVIFGDQRLVRTPDEMARVAREALPGGTILDVNDTLARLRVPTTLVDNLELLHLPLGARQVAPVFRVSRDPADDQPYIPTGEVIVVFNSAHSLSEAAAWGEARGIELVREVGVANGFVFICPDEITCLNTSRDLYADARTRYAYPNWLRPRQTRVFGNADLAITKTASTNLVPFGENVTFTVTVDNQGPSAASSVVIADALPSALTLISASIDQGFCSTFRGISCTVSSLDNGAQATLTIVAQATTAGQTVNTATVNSRITGDPDQANNEASVEILVCAPGVPCKGADLSVQKTVTPNPAVIGENLTYAIVVTNAGPDTATGVQLTDALPSDISLVSSSVTPSGTCSGVDPVSCSLPDLANGSSATITLEVTPGAAGQFNNSATVSATSPDPNLTNNTGSVTVTVLSNAHVPNDPLFANQWHLENRGQGGGIPGEDANVLPAWDSHKGSKEQIIAIVDDGVEIDHEDLAPNVVPDLSYDFVSNKSDPTAGRHGTAVAGVAAAAGFNGQGVSGTAPMAGLVGIRLLNGLGTTDADEAEALGWRNDAISAYNNSWGPADDGRRLEGPGPLTQAALANATAKGRGGKGNIFCWAGGNGGDNDNSNYDGYANSRYTIAVAASTNTGRRAPYSEKGANLLVNAPSSGGTLSITTTDRTGTDGYDPGNYTSGFGGTSSATPIVCGVVALMLQANPALSWRDVKYLLATTAARNDPFDEDWKINGAGHWVNHKYGFGRVDATAAVEAAAGWTPLGNYFVGAFSTSVNQPILDNAEVLSTITVALDAEIEFVEVVLDAVHDNWDDLELVLTSPMGTQSVLAEHNPSGISPNSFTGWIYTSERHLDEFAAGSWTLGLRDRRLGHTGQFKGWTLRLYLKEGSGQVDPQADLSLTKTANPDPVIVGQQLTYTIQVFNNGPNSATGIKVVDSLPDKIDLLSTSVSPSGSCSGSAILNCTLPDLGNGDSATVSIVARPNSPGTIQNQASVSANQADPNPENNSQSVVTTVNAQSDVTRTLNVTVVGPGVVSSSPPTGINCPTNCVASIVEGSLVTLTASTTGQFLRWSGACSGSTPTCSVEMTADKRVYASFR